MSEKMYKYMFLNKILDALNEKVKSSEFSDLLFNNRELTRNQPVDDLIISSLVMQVSMGNDADIIRVMADFLESDTENDLEQKQLIVAVLKNDLEKTEYLLKNGLKIEDFKNKWEDEIYRLPALFSSMLYRKTNNQMKMLRLLVNYGLNIHIVNVRQNNLYHLLAGMRIDGGTSVKMAQIFYDAGLTAIDQINHIDEHAPLHRAILYNNLELAKFFVNKGADVSRIEGSVLRYPLTTAVINNNEYINEDMVDLLLSHGANLNHRDYFSGCTVLFLANDFNCPRAVYFLLKKGADLNVEDENGETPIFSIDINSDDYNKCLIAMIKELAKSSCISETNMNFIKSNPKAQELLQKCSKELSLMKSTIFYAPFSYDAILRLSKKLKKLSNLTKNEDFVTAFKANLDKFSYFKEDLKEILGDAVRVRDESVMIKSYLKSAFGDVLPDLVIEYLAKNISTEDVRMK